MAKHENDENIKNSKNQKLTIRQKDKIINKTNDIPSNVIKNDINKKQNNNTENRNQ